MFKCYFANRNEFLRDSSRIEQIPPNIRNDILSESGLTRRTSRLQKKNETSRIPPESIKNQFVAIRVIRGLCGIGVLDKILGRLASYMIIKELSKQDCHNGPGSLACFLSPLMAEGYNRTNSSLSHRKVYFHFGAKLMHKCIL